MHSVTLLKIISFYTIVISSVLAQEKSSSGSLNQIVLRSNTNKDSNHIYKDPELADIILLESLNKTLDITLSNLTIIEDNFTIDNENILKILKKVVININNCTIALNNFHDYRFGKGIFEQSQSILFYALHKIFKIFIRDDILISANLNNVKIKHGNKTYYYFNEDVKLNQDSKEKKISRYLNISHDVSKKNDRRLQENTCQYFTDCFTCTYSLIFNLNCEWTTGGCLQTNNPAIYNNWFDYFNVCYHDTAALNEMTTYCGNFSLHSPPYTAGLLDVGGSYGTSNLFCKWTVNNDNNYKDLFVNYTILLNNMDQLCVEIKYLDGTSNFFNPTSNQNFYFTAQNALNIDVYMFIYKSSPILPFIISFSNISPAQGNPNYIGLGISIGTILIIALLCAFLLFKCSRIIIEQRNRQRNIILRHQRDITFINEQQRIEELRKRNKEKLEILYTTELMPMIYDLKLNDYQTNCTICLEEFKMNTEVMKFSCKHLFHYSCGKSWFEKNILNLKCPNCNLMIIAEENVEGVQNHRLILNDNRINNANNTMINLPEQNVRIVTHIIDTQPRTGRGVQFSQNMNIQIYNPSDNSRVEDNIEIATRNNYVINYRANAEMLERENRS